MGKQLMGVILLQTESENILSVEIERRNSEKFTPPKQSANTLFRFFKRPNYLFEALKAGAMIPRYYPEDVDYLGIGYHQIAYPMVCFCDITVHRLEEHMDLYGNYGIAFSKTWGIMQGVQPLQYMNKHSILCQDFSIAFRSAIETEQDIPAVNYLLTQMLYMKPIEGAMPRDGKTVDKNFTDECEWRFIPNVAEINLPQAVMDSEMASIGILNETISENEICWLKFRLSDVKYIILQDETDFEDLCSLVEEITDDVALRRKLISKVILWSNAKEDF